MDRRLALTGFNAYARLTRPRVVDKSQRTPEQQALVEACRNDFGLFVREFFPEHIRGEFSPLHQYLIDRKNNQKPGVVDFTAAPRGNCKTTLGLTLEVIHDICYKLTNFIVIIGYSSTEGKMKLTNIKTELLENEKLIEHFGLLIKPKTGSIAFTTNNGVRVVATGRGGQVRGLLYKNYRPQKIYCDDIESTEGVQTPEQRDKTEKWFKTDVKGCFGADKTGILKFYGTALHTEALLLKSIKSGAVNGHIFRSMIQWPQRMDLWQKWKAIYTDLTIDAEERKEQAHAYYQAHKTEMDEGAEVLWPSGEPLEILWQYIAENGMGSFNAEKQNDPYDPDKQLFNPDIVPRFTVQFNTPKSNDDTGFPGFNISLGDRVIRSSQVNTIIFHDPAMAEATKSDYAALSVCGQDDDGYVYVLESWIERTGPDKQIKKALDLAAKWGGSRIYLEDNGFQGLLKQAYKEAVAARPELSNTRVLGVSQHTNKQQRISMLEPYFENGHILFNSNLNPLLIDQLRQFPTGHDDGPDSLQGAVSRLRRPMGGKMEVH